MRRKGETIEYVTSAFDGNGEKRSGVIADTITSPDGKFTCYKLMGRNELVTESQVINVCMS